MRRISYIYEFPAWPDFEWDSDALAEKLGTVRHQQGRLVGRMEGLGFRLRQEAVLQTLTNDVVKSSEIEGERLDAQQVRSSVARRLGINIGALKAVDRHVDGVVEMTLDATSKYDQPLSSERLFAWHSAMFPAGRSGMSRILTGRWRDDGKGPMQVISGAVGHEHIHYEAPPAKRVSQEMRKFLRWFNGNHERSDWAMNAALAHLWFVTVHPFEDGNGRIARVIADMALARSEKISQRFYSMSTEIRKERSDYYKILERTQKGSLDVTPWMVWFLGCLGRAIEGAQDVVDNVLAKARFWESIANTSLNERQHLVLNRLLEDFEGSLTTTKWARLTETSHDTATRDIARLLELGILVRNPGGGRSTSYSLKELALSK